MPSKSWPLSGTVPSQSCSLIGSPNDPWNAWEIGVAALGSNETSLDKVNLINQAAMAVIGDWTASSLPEQALIRAE